MFDLGSFIMVDYFGFISGIGIVWHTFSFRKQG